MEGERYPRCTAGRRAAPPEDSGGVWGYEAMLALLADPDGADRADAELMEMLPEDFDPASVDLEEINEALADVSDRPE